MKTYSSEQLPTYQVSGQDLRIHWDAKEVPAPGMDESAMQWEQEEALCDVADSYGQLVAKIIGAVYDHNAEFAAINDGGEKYEAYQAFRAQAKALAKGWADR
jgi:hypothetical protein